MFRKRCPDCNGDSFSSSDRGKWTCPYCERDLTEVKAKPAGRERGRTPAREPPSQETE